jgi:predicted nucleotidyltransferase
MVAVMTKRILSVDEIRKSVIPICQRYGVSLAYLFGSYSRNEATEDSDVDIRIEKGRLRGLFALSGFRLDIVEALQKEVDVVSQRPDTQEFLDNLKRDEVLLYEA